MKLNYRIEAIKELLNKDCILERYYSLIPNKEKMIDFCMSMNCNTKEECLQLPDEIMLQSGVLNQAEINLFRGFLSREPRNIEVPDSFFATQCFFSFLTA